MNNTFFTKIFLLFTLLVLIPEINIKSQSPLNNIGDLTKQDHIDVLIELHGRSGHNHYFSPKELKFFTGKLYKLIIANKSDSPHYFSSNDFVKSIFTRKIQILKSDNKIAEIKGYISEIEVFPGNNVEWWFVPLKTGVFDDLQCDIYDKNKKKKHSEMGMRGVIIIE